MALPNTYDSMALDLTAEAMGAWVTGTVTSQ